MKSVKILNVAVIVMSFITVNVCFSQNILVLKNGDKMNGKLESFKDGVLIFNVQGNKLKFKSVDITSVVLDGNEQNLKNNSTIQDAKVTGVITYFFNENYGAKPDVGSKVFIVDTKNVLDFDITTVDSAYYASMYRSIYKSYILSNQPVPERINEGLKKWNIKDKSLFDSLDKRAYKNLLNLEFAENVKQSVVDGNGNYSIKVTPGSYYIYIKSNNRKGNGMIEVSGKIFYKQITVKDGEEVNVSTNFGM